MKTQFLILFTSVLAVHAASVLPLDNTSSSSVKVNQNGNEYSYTIKENKAIALEPLPIIPIIETTTLNGKPSQPIILREIKNDNIIENKKDEAQDKADMKVMEPSQSMPKLDEEKMKLKEPIRYELRGGQILEHQLREHYQIIPGYRLIPANDIILEYPYFYPYVHDPAYRYIRI